MLKYGAGWGYPNRRRSERFTQFKHFMYLSRTKKLEDALTQTIHHIKWIAHCICKRTKIQRLTEQSGCAEGEDEDEE